MIVSETCLSGVLILEPKVFGDDRGFFYESFNQNEFCNIVGADIDFVQDNHSKSSKNVLRGLHYQTEHTQGKLVRVIKGAVYDVVVDLRKNSPNYGEWFGLELSSTNKKQLWIPAGMAHGFLVLEDETEFVYKCTDYYHPQSERSLLWNDPTVGINWPIDEPQLLLISDKDQKGELFENTHAFKF